MTPAVRSANLLRGRADAMVNSAKPNRDIANGKGCSANTWQLFAYGK
jgi:hypothetical protein